MAIARQHFRIEATKRLGHDDDSISFLTFFQNRLAFCVLLGSSETDMPLIEALCSSK